MLQFKAVSYKSVIVARQCLLLFMSAELLVENHFSSPPPHRLLRSQLQRPLPFALPLRPPPPCSCRSRSRLSSLCLCASAPTPPSSLAGPFCKLSINNKWELANIYENKKNVSTVSVEIHTDVLHIIYYTPVSLFKMTTLTFQSFSEWLQESFKLHLLHGCQHVSGVQSFSLCLHGKIVCTVKVYIYKKPL